MVSLAKEKRPYDSGDKTGKQNQPIDPRKPFVIRRDDQGQSGAEKRNSDNQYLPVIGIAKDGPASFWGRPGNDAEIGKDEHERREANERGPEKPVFRKLQLPLLIVGSVNWLLRFHRLRCRRYANNEAALWIRCSPLVARRAARLDEGKSTRTVRVPWQGTFCVPCQVEFRSRLIESGSAGLPREYGARHQGRPSFGYLSRPRKKGDQLPGCPRPALRLCP
jgi:hypothetical protein